MVTWCSGLLLTTTSPSVLSWPYNFGPLLLRLSSTLFLPVFRVTSCHKWTWVCMQNQTPDGKQGCLIKEQAWNFHSTVVETMHQRPEMGLRRRDGANTFPRSLRCAKLAVLTGLFTGSSTGCLTAERRNTTFWSFSSRTQLCVYHAVSMLITWFQYLPLLSESMYEIWDFSYLWFPIYIVSLLTEVIQWILYREFMEGGLSKGWRILRIHISLIRISGAFSVIFPLQNQRFEDIFASIILALPSALSPLCVPAISLWGCSHLCIRYLYFDLLIKLLRNEFC